jgi:DNA-binding IscR family transcriptional regulator
MRLTTKGRFAVTAMLDLAMREANGPVTWPASASAKAFPFPIWNSCSANCAVPNW